MAPRNTADQSDTILLRTAASDWSIGRLLAEYQEPMFRHVITSFALSPHSGQFRLSSLIYNKLKTSRANEFLPEQALKTLRANHLEILAQEMIKQKWLIDIGGILAGHGVTAVMLLKAAAFNGFIYNLNAPRPGSDIDLLSSKADLPLVTRIFENQLLTTFPGLEERHEFKISYERSFYTRHQNPLHIDMHSAIANPFFFKVDYPDLFATSREHPAYQTLPLRRPSPEYALLHLAIHTLVHLHVPLHSILDAHELIITGRADIDRTVELADQWGAKGALYLLLSCCEKKLHTPIDHGKIECLRGPAVRRMISLLGRKKPFTDTFAVFFRLREMALQCIMVDNLGGTLCYWIYYSRLRLVDMLYRKFGLRRRSV